MNVPKMSQRSRRNTMFLAYTKSDTKASHVSAAAPSLSWYRIYKAHLVTIAEDKFVPHRCNLGNWITKGWYVK